ncbi:uncharacterized protein METZ01_LOCUS381158, partial [marine metagenome]
ILSDETVTVAVGDNDQVSVVTLESDGSTGTTESGGTDSFTVTLNIQPTAGDVIVAVSSSDTGEVAVAPATLTFNSGNWNTGLTVTVTGVADTTVDGTQNATIALSVVGGSSDTDVAVSVTNDDNDSSTVTTTTTPTTTEPPVVLEPEVLLSAFAVEDDGFVTWVPSRTDGLQSYVLAWSRPSEGWTTHDSYQGSDSLKDTLVGLADGDHSFQVFATYTDGAYAESNIASITVPTPPPGPTVNPEPIDVDPFDCAAFPSLIQVMGTPGVGHSVKQLDVTSGQYSEIFSISANRSPPYT